MNIVHYNTVHYSETLPSNGLPLLGSWVVEKKFFEAKGHFPDNQGFGIKMARPPVHTLNIIL